MAAWPLAARAQGRAPLRSIGVIMNYPEADPAGQTRLSALRNQLHKLGWIEGNNILLEARWPAGNADRMRADATEIISGPADVIVANSTSLLQTLKRLTQTIPIVFTQVADPVGNGFVDSFPRPGGNITGFSDFDKSIAGKWTEVLKEAVPSVSRVTVLMDPNESNHQGFLGVIEASAPLLNIQAFPVGVRDQAEIEVAIKALAGQTDRGLVILPGPINNRLRHSIIELVARYRMPAVYPFKYYSKDGGLLYYGVDQVDQWSNAAGYVDRILKGEKPADLPVQAPTKYELVVNLKTAKALGLTIQPTLLARADEVIE